MSGTHATRRRWRWLTASIAALIIFVVGIRINAADVADRTVVSPTLSVAANPPSWLPTPSPPSADSSLAPTPTVTAAAPIDPRRSPLATHSNPPATAPTPTSTAPASSAPTSSAPTSTAPTAASDFSITLTPSSASVNPGSSVSSTVPTALTGGSAQTVNLNASGLPTGATATFNPSSIISGGSSTLMFATTPTTAAGTYPVTVTGLGTSATHTAIFQLIVNNPPPCTGTNPTDVAIPDNTTVASMITISGCAGNASAASTAEVHIVHTYRCDLVVRLVAPDGTVYTLLSFSGGSEDNVDQTFTVNLSSETRNGSWTLSVQDAADQDTGYINSWTLSL